MTPSETTQTLRYCEFSCRGCTPNTRFALSGFYVPKGEKMPTVGGYVNDETYELTCQKAEKAGMTKSQFVGFAVRKAVIVPRRKDDLKLQEIQQRQEIKKAIDRIGANVNQITVHCNINKKVDLAVLERLANIERLLSDVKQNI